MADRHTRKTPQHETRPKIWAEGSQNPPFELRALARASLFLSREGIGWIFAGTARLTRAGALGVRDGVGRIPAARLGRVAPYVPSHQRVAMWISTFAAIQAHASATADPDASRGNALVAEIETHLWPHAQAGADSEASPAAPVLLPEPGAGPTSPTPPPPGDLARTAIQVTGYLLGWPATVIALPYGLIRALVAYASGQDLRKIGPEG